MESSMAKELALLAEKVEMLAAQRDEAREELKLAYEEIADLRQQLGKSAAELKAKEIDVEFLTVSNRLSDTPQGLADARATVRRMLEKVNKAIELLKHDARL